MSNQISTQTISFYGSDLITLKIEDVIYTAVRPIVEALGLSWSTQKQKLDRSNEKFSCVHMNTSGSDGKSYEMLCMPIRKLNGWLFSINPAKVRSDLREKVIRYQEECFEALYNYWTHGKAERSTTTVDDRTGLRDAVNMIVSKKGLLYSDAYSLIHQYMNVQHIDEIPKEQLPAAVAYCHKIVLEGELILNTPEETERKLNLNSEGVNAIINCYYTATRMQEAVQFLLNQLNTFRSSSLDSVRFNCEVMEKYIREAHPHVEGLVKQRYRSKTSLMPQIGY